jgi:selenium metabolism protein YedF
MFKEEAMSEAAVDNRQHQVTDSSSGKRDMVVYIASEGMGRGDEALGVELMSKFLDTLSHLKDRISHLIFVNAGAKLVVEGSPVLEQLQHLEGVGVELLACGTCLNHFGITDKVAVGSVSNMVAILDTLSEAGTVIRP